MIWVLTAMLIVLWLIGLAFDAGGAFVNVLLLIAAVLVTLELAKWPRRPAERIGED